MAVDEWVFAAHTDHLGVIAAHRLIEPAEGEPRVWYWAAVVERQRPLVVVSEFEVPVRADRFVAKAEGLWAEQICDVPLEQWSVSNEAFAVALDDPAAALGRAYGDPTPLAIDLEWYATAAPRPIECGFEQAGVVHGVVEIAGRARTELSEDAARRWRRWCVVDAGERVDALPTLPPLPVPIETMSDETMSAGMMSAGWRRAPIALGDGTVLDLVLTPAGWCRRE